MLTQNQIGLIADGLLLLVSAGGGLTLWVSNRRYNRRSSQEMYTLYHDHLVKWRESSYHTPGDEYEQDLCRYCVSITVKNIRLVRKRKWYTRLISSLTS